MSVSADLWTAIAALEHRYARVLDDDELEAWPQLFTADGVYQVIPRENQRFDPPLAVMSCNNRDMMIDRVTSLRSANIYNLHYPRHVISNIEVLGQQGDAYEVAAVYTVYQTDLEGETRLFSVGRYRDLIVREEGELKFRRKLVFCDTFNIRNLLAIPL